MSGWVRVGGPGEVEFVGEAQPQYDAQFVTDPMPCKFLFSRDYVTSDDPDGFVGYRTDLCYGDVHGLVVRVDGVPLCWEHVPGDIKALIEAEYGHKWIAHPAARLFNEARAAGLFGEELRYTQPAEKPAYVEGERVEELLRRPPAIVGERGFLGRPIDPVREW